MSPRSEEFHRRARERLAGARKNVEQDEFAIAVGAAYYAMLYAARAALSEHDLSAKTHRGTWNLLRQTFVRAGAVPAELVAEAERTAELREAADYDAAGIDREQAEYVLASAERFLAALDRLIDGSSESRL